MTLISFGHIVCQGKNVSEKTDMVLLSSIKLIVVGIIFLKWSVQLYLMLKKLVSSAILAVFARVRTIGP